MAEITWPRFLHHPVLEAFIPRSPEEGMKMLADGWYLSPADFPKGNEPETAEPEATKRKGGRPRKV